MKHVKKALSLLLVMAMVMGMTVVPVMGASRSDYKAALIGAEMEVGTNNNKVIHFDFQVEGSLLAGTQQAMIKYDKSKLTLARYSNGNNNLTIPTDVYDAVNGASSQALTYYDEENEEDVTVFQQPTVYARDMGDGYVVVGIQVKPQTATTDYCNGSLKTIGSFRLGLNDGVSYDDLDSTSIQWATANEAHACNQNAAVFVNDGSVDIGHNIYNTIPDEFDNAPVLTYTGSDIRALAKVEVKLDKVSINTPVELPEAGETVTVASTVKAFDVADVEFTAADNVSYTYSLSMKDDSELSNKITVDENGVISVAAGAPKGTVVLTAEASYTKTNGQVSTLSGTAELVLSHGSATSDAPTDPEPDPDDVDPDVEKVFSGVKVSKDGDVVVTSATGSSHSETIGIPTSGSSTVTFVGTPVNQYGDPFAGVTGSWDDAVTTGAGTTVSNGIVTVATGAAGADFDYEFSATQDATTYTAKVNVVVSNTVINWPTLTNDTITYGQPISDLTFDNDGTITDHGTDVTASATFAWDVADDSATLNAGTNTLTMKVDYTDSASAAQTATKDYAITVKQAKLKIVIDETLTLEGTSLEVPLDETVDLGTKVVNSDVTDGDGNNLVTTVVPTYALSGNTALVEQNATTPSAFKGLVQSTNGTDVTTVTISAAGDTNYIAADDKAVELYVAKPVLKATIAFDTENPVFGQEITATITEHSGQPGSLTTDVTYAWGKIVTDEESGKTTFEALSGETSGNLTPNGDGTATVKYTPVAADVGTTLALMVSTPPGEQNPDYGWIHSVEASMANPVAKAGQNAPTAAGTTATRDTITVTSITLDGVEIDLTVATAAAEDGDNLVFALVAEGAAAPADADYSTNKVFTQTADGTNLTLNTKYDLYVMNTASDTHNASSAYKQTVSTAQINIGPDPDETDDDVNIVDPAATITLTGDAKFGSELTATTTPAKFTVGDDPTEITVDYDTFVWERQALDENGDADGDPVVIDGATSDKYTLTADDIGCKITVKASPAPTSDYSGLLTATTEKVDKADRTLSADGVEAEPESKAGEEDGKITNLPKPDPDAQSGFTYEYILKPEGEVTEADWATPLDTLTVADASADSDIENLAAGTYLVRIMSTATHNASNAIEVTVPTAGHAVTGEIITMNAANGMTYTLLDEGGNEVAGHTDATLTLTTPDTLIGRQQQSFTIEAVPDGTYTLVIKKDNHLDLNIKNLVVNGGDLDLTVYHTLFSMGEGDLNGDGLINANDGNIITRVANFNKGVETAGVTDKHADLDGNTLINANDGNIITASRNFNKRTSDFDVTLSYPSES